MFKTMGAWGIFCNVMWHSMKNTGTTKKVKTVVTVMSIWTKQQMQRCRMLPFYQFLPYKWVHSAGPGIQSMWSLRNIFEIAKHRERKCSRRFNYLNYHTEQFLTICPSRVTWITAPFLFRFLLCKHSHPAHHACCNINEPAFQLYSEKMQNRCAWVYLRKGGGRVVLRCRSKFSRLLYCHFGADFDHKC